MPLDLDDWDCGCDCGCGDIPNGIPDAELDRPDCMAGRDFENWPIAMAYVPMQQWEETYDPVSYTHLDVYKRQVIGTIINCIAVTRMVIAPTAKSPPYFRSEVLKHTVIILSVNCIIKGESPSAIHGAAISFLIRKYCFRSFKNVF